VPLLECVPNFSEGRRPEVIQRLAEAVRGASGVRLLDVSSDRDHHRSVLTFVGVRPEAVWDAAFRSAAEAVAAIDVRVHRGVHPRIGAVDVIPFVPLSGIPLESCVALARTLGEAVAARLGVPVYLYGAAAATPDRRALPAIRRGGFEGLLGSIALPDRRPDFGPSRLHPGAGAVAIGARPVLIALNANLDSADLEAARRIARTIRQSSGGLPAVQAMGVLLESRGLVQVSMNLLDYHRTSPLTVFGCIAAEAARMGIEIAEMELIGCAPRDALPADPVTTLKLKTLRPEQVLDIDELSRDMSGT
jgi:glutamate formiminotransferase